MFNKLVLLRHGESQWNLENRFTGWTDINLSDKGIEEAKSAGQILKSKDIHFDIVFTSLLKRAIKTMEICLNELGANEITINQNWRLNERHYGSLQGLNKLETAKKYGDKQVLIWRRSYKIAPPPLDSKDKRHPRFDKKYIKLKPSLIPDCESLKDTKIRFMPLWNNSIKPNLQSGKKLLIVAHGNSLRAIVKYLDAISDSNILKLNIPTGVPLVYELNNNLKPIKHYYLDNKISISTKTKEIKLL